MALSDFKAVVTVGECYCCQEQPGCIMCLDSGEIRDVVTFREFFDDNKEELLQLLFEMMESFILGEEGING